MAKTQLVPVSASAPRPGSGSTRPTYGCPSRRPAMSGRAIRGLRLVRDSFGIPHVDAPDESSAWWGLGYACAQDRAFQLDYDRRRACGRLAEVLGPAVLEGDVLARKLDLARSAKADLRALSPISRSSLDAYAGGVNAAWERHGRPPEIWWDLEPWQP